MIVVESPCCKGHSEVSLINTSYPQKRLKSLKKLEPTVGLEPTTG